MSRKQALENEWNLLVVQFYLSRGWDCSAKVSQTKRIRVLSLARWDLKSGIQKGDCTRSKWKIFVGGGWLERSDEDSPKKILFRAFPMCKMVGTLAKSKNVCATPRNFQPSALLFDFKGYWISLRDKIICLNYLFQMSRSLSIMFLGGGKPLQAFRAAKNPHSSYKNDSGS